MKIKVCGMTNPLNVSEIAGARPDFIGYVFYRGSPRFVGEKPDKELFRNVPDGIKKAGVFMNDGYKTILDISVLTGLDLIQLHGDELPEFCLQLKSTGLGLIKAFNIDSNFDFEALRPYHPVCDFFLFDTRTGLPGGSGIKFDWKKLEEYSLDKPFFLSGGIGPEDCEVIRDIINKGFFAVDINSRFETSPGIKDANLVRSFIEKIKTEKL